MSMRLSAKQCKDFISLEEISANIPNPGSTDLAAASDNWTVSESNFEIVRIMSAQYDRPQVLVSIGGRP